MLNIYTHLKNLILFTITLIVHKNSQNLTLTIFKLSAYKYLQSLLFHIRFLAEQLQTTTLIVVSKAEIVRQGGNGILCVAFSYVLLRISQSALTVTSR